MARYRLNKLVNETRPETYWSKYKKQKIFCMSLLRKTKREYFSNLNVKNVSNIKAFTILEQQ